MSSKDSSFRLQSGAALDVTEGGDPRGRPIFVLHGSPGSRVLYGPHIDHARKKGLRLISFSRPGYGGSSRQEGRDVADGVAPVAAIADELRIEKFGVWGHSGGGKYALACAALLPRRVVAASCLSALAPMGAQGLDWFAGMGKSNEDDFKLMMTDRKAWEKGAEEQAKMLVAGEPTKENVIMSLSSLLSEVDRSMVTDEFAAFLGASVKSGLSQGAGGWIDDALSDGMNWGFDMASIKVPTQVWHGRHDMFCPFAHGEWLARHVPDTEAHLEPEEGHLSMFVRRVPEAQEWLLSKF